MAVQLPAVPEEKRPFYLKPIVNIEEALEARQAVKDVVAGYLREGEDFGTIPGAGTKQVLFKSGAEKLCETFGLYPEYEILTEMEDWDKAPPLFDYKIKCTLRTQGADVPVGSGLGSCSSYESKYRYRTAGATCPECKNADAMRKDKEAKDRSYCWTKIGGCGWQGPTPKGGGKVDNPDLADQKNTVLKMACKRAHVAATITAIHASDMFTQDLEDNYRGAAPKQEQKPAEVEVFDVEEIEVAKAETVGIMAPLPPPTPLNEIDLGNGGFRDLYAAVKHLSKMQLLQLADDMGCHQDIAELWTTATDPIGVVALEAILRQYKVSITLPPGQTKKVVTNLTADVFEKTMEHIHNV